jgi:hypothetical protein
MSRKANRRVNRAEAFKTSLGTLVTTKGNEITLETPRAKVVQIGTAKNLAWLMADVLSTPSGYRS